MWPMRRRSHRGYPVCLKAKRLTEASSQTGEQITHSSPKNVIQSNSHGKNFAKKNTKYIILKRNLNLEQQKKTSNQKKNPEFLGVLEDIRISLENRSDFSLGPPGRLVELIQMVFVRWQLRAFKKVPTVVESVPTG